MLSRGGDSSPKGSHFFRVYDHSLPHTCWPPVTWKGSGTHVPLSIQAKLLEPLLVAIPRLCFRPTYRPDWPAPILQYFYFYFLKVKIEYVENIIFK
ncbi:unnamed protein product [Spirodela intermedia]|uniref:Uncharacterized protein n=1 Tax=Spirodela intermedia TaxID=51605 RepID=A0A7I8L0B6_SPIIN|nr:unnamed protein product [Spirodela intermedia]